MQLFDSAALEIEGGTGDEFLLGGVIPGCEFDAAFGDFCNVCLGETVSVGCESDVDEELERNVEKSFFLNPFPFFLGEGLEAELETAAGLSALFPGKTGATFDIL